MFLFCVLFVNSTLRSSFFQLIRNRIRLWEYVCVWVFVGCMQLYINALTICTHPWIVLILWGWCLYAVSVCAEGNFVLCEYFRMWFRKLIQVFLLFVIQHVQTIRTTLYYYCYLYFCFFVYYYMYRHWCLGLCLFMYVPMSNLLCYFARSLIAADRRNNSRSSQFVSCNITSIHNPNATLSICYVARICFSFSCEV